MNHPPLSSARAAVLCSRTWDRLARPWSVALLLLPAAVYVLLCHLLIFPPFPLFIKDMTTYLDFTPYRPLGYPLLLKTALLFVSDPFSLVVAQLALGLLAVVFLAETVNRFFRNPLYALLLGLLLLFNTFLFMMGITLGPDYSYFVLLCFHLGLLLLALDNPAPRTLLALAAVTALAAWIRPVSLTLVIFGGPWLLLMEGKRVRTWLLYGFLPLVALLLAQTTLHAWVHGYFGLLRMNHSTLANALLLPDPPRLDGLRGDILARMIDETAEYRAHLWDPTIPDETRFQALKKILPHIIRTVANMELMEYDQARLCPQGQDDMTNRWALLTFFDRNSAANWRFTRFMRPEGENWEHHVPDYQHWWNCHEDFRAGLSRELNRGKGREIARVTLLKTIHTWEGLFDNPGRIEVDTLRDHMLVLDNMPPAGKVATVLDNKSSDGRLRFQDPPYLSLRPFHWVAHYTRHLPKLLHTTPAMLTLLFGVIVIIGYLAQRWRKKREDISPWAALSYMAVNLFGYAVVLNFVHVAYARYLIVMMPLSLALLLSPLLLLPSPCSSRTALPRRTTPDNDGPSPL